MIDGDFLPRQNQPITIHVIGGEFIVKTPLGDCFYKEIEGDFIKIFQCTYKSFDYWSIQIKDETNTYNVILPIKSACARNLILTLYDEKFSYLVLQAYFTDRNRIKLYADKMLMEVKHIDLPKIRHIYRNGKEWHDYTDRLKTLAAMANQINKDNIRA